MRFAIRRLAMLVISLLVASFGIFGSMYLAPGTPLAALGGSKGLSPQAQAVLEQRYHLNAPFFTQYWDWLTGALHGDLGISIQLNENVSTLIGTRAATTASLVLYASLIICVLGIGIGVLAGLKPGKLDTSVLVATSISAALPAFVAATLLTLLFAVEVRWFPALGNGVGLLDNVRHFTLPAFALALSSLAVVARVTRAAVREEAGREHVQTAISRGISLRQIVRRHILRNAAIPVATVFAITIASLIAVAAVVETAFSLDGLGSQLIQSAQDKDLAVVQGISLLLVAAFVVANTAADMLYAVLDPRVTLGSRYR